MSSPVPPGLVLVIGLFVVQAQHVAAQGSSAPAASRYIFEILPSPIQEAQNDELVVVPAPLPTPFATPVPTPIATPVATPTPVPSPVPTPVPTPVSTPVATPIPTPVQTPTPTPVPTPIPVPSTSPPKSNRPAFPVPPPYPERGLARPPIPQIEPFALIESRRAQWKTWQVEVWHNDSKIPQRPIRRGRQFETAYLMRTEPALVRFQFLPLAAGKAVNVLPGPGVIVDPPGTKFQIGSTGEVVVSVALDSRFYRSFIDMDCFGIRSKLPLSRASLPPTQEAATRGGQ